MPTTIVWYRNDLRIHDHPALMAAINSDSPVLPIFILDPNLLDGRHASTNRNRFLFESLSDLRQSLQQIGGELLVATGKPESVLLELAKKFNADKVFYTADFTPYALRRDKAVRAALQDHGIITKGYPGRLIVDELQAMHSKNGNPHKVFTPFWRQWATMARRPICSAPNTITVPEVKDAGSIPTTSGDTSPDALNGGETAGRQRMHAFLDAQVQKYVSLHNDLGAQGTSRLSSYLHFGCLSARELESLCPAGDNASAYVRQLAWRDFYHYILFHFPANSTLEFQERYRQLQWKQDKKALEMWKNGTTGYPIVDAAMRQLLREGWMHNRARLIVGSFLTKDLGIDWREGERHFMRWLIDGDQANNNGNWQWITSVGVDPAPVFRRLYNPVLQQQKFDPTGAYVKKYVPELKYVPDKYLAEPWTMPSDIQKQANCIIGKGYPVPIVDHAAARQEALERYRSTNKP